MRRDERGQASGDGLFAFIGVVILIAIVVSVFSAFTAFKKTPADKIALSYGGGIFEGNAFQKIVNPGSGLVNNGFFDKWYEYPATQRNYIISTREGEGDVEGADSITASTEDKVLVQYEVAVYFKLNTNNIREFHEGVGLKYKAWEDDGWDRMLNDHFRQPIESALQTESRKFTVEQLFADEEALLKVQEGIASNLKERVNTLSGDTYFCGPTFEIGKEACPDFQVILKKPTFPEQIVKAFESNKRSEADIQTATNNARVKEEEARGTKAAQDALRGQLTDEYIRLLEAQAMQECAKNQNCTLVITNGGSGVNVNTR